MIDPNYDADQSAKKSPPKLTEEEKEEAEMEDAEAPS